MKKAKYQVMLEEAIYQTAVAGVPEKVRPISMVGHNTYSQYSVDHTEQYCAYLRKLGIAYSIGNDAPRGGKLGNYIEVTYSKCVYQFAFNKWKNAIWNRQIGELSALILFMAKCENVTYYHGFEKIEEKALKQHRDYFTNIYYDERKVALDGALIVFNADKRGWVL